MDGGFEAISPITGKPMKRFEYLQIVVESNEQLEALETMVREAKGHLTSGYFSDAKLVGPRRVV